MRRLLLVVLAFISSHTDCMSQSESGPHTARSPIKNIRLSGDGKRMLTTSWYEAVIWNTADNSVIRTLDIEASGLKLSDDYYFVTDPAMKMLWLKGFSVREGALVDIDKWTMTKVTYTVDYISATGVGVSWSPAKETSLVDLQTGAETKVGELDGFYAPDLAPDGNTMISGNGKRSKVYNFLTNKFSSYKREAGISGNYSVDIQPVKGTITMKPANITRPFAVGGGSVPEYAREVFLDRAKGHLGVNENLNVYDAALQQTVYQHYLVVYDLNTGEVVKKIALNGSVEAAKAKQVQEKRIADEKKAAEEAARQARIANAKPGFKEFDAKFTELKIPFTMNYSSAQGFALNDAFFSNDMTIRSGTEVFGMGKICSCSDNSSYLLMFRNKTESTDLSNFIIVSYNIDGTRSGMRTIGATQKDPSGLTRLDFTITGGFCGYQVKAAMTYPNGNSQDKSFSFGACNVR